MSLDLASGVTVRVDPPVVPEIRVQAPSSTTVVVPVAGPPGPPGMAGGAYLRHEQTTPASVVTVEHGFGRWPSSVTLTSLDGSTTFVTFGLEFLDLDTIRISIDQPTAYVALIA